jgi:hypothetical protein
LCSPQTHLDRYVKIHQLAEPAPEEDWLRANARILRD